MCRNGSQVLRTLALITDHSATARLDANIPYWLVFEGYHGHWEWPEETRSAYRRFLLAAVREALRDIRQPERVLLQG